MIALAGVVAALGLNCAVRTVAGQDLLGEDHAPIAQQESPIGHAILGSASRDKDGDGLTDLEELHIGTRPDSEDSDRDGMPDGYEITHGLDPTVFSAHEDKDRDGVLNFAEFDMGTDPSTPDTDADGLRDGDEVQLGTDPLGPDSDSDGLADGDEVRSGLNPLSSDTDKDGLNDFLETNPDPAIFGDDPDHNPDPLKTDIYLEIDWMADEEVSNAPPETLLDDVIGFYSSIPIRNPDGSTGIRLHIDAGLPAHDLGGGGSVPYIDTSTSMGFKPVWDMKDGPYFSSNRKGVFHYGVVVPDIGAGRIAGQAAAPGDFLMLSGRYLGEGAFSVHVLAHEIGHNVLGLLDQENQAPGAPRHTRYLCDLMYVGPNGCPHEDRTLHPNVVEELQRHGVGISFS